MRLGKIIQVMNVRDDTKISLKLVKLVFFLALYTHFSACLWFYFVNFEKIWNITNSESFYEDSAFSQYLWSMHTAVLVLTGNDLQPQTPSETVLGGVLVLVGAIYNGNILGNMAILIQALNKRIDMQQ